MAKLSRSNKQQWLDADRKKAMPAVKKLVKKHGRNVVVWCINQLKEYEKKIKRLKELKKETSELEKEINQ